MEQLYRRNIVIREAGETSSGQSPTPMIQKGIRRRAVRQYKSLPSTESMFKMVMEAGETAKTKSPNATPKIQTIQKFAFLLRENKGFKKYYEPRAVSLGPIHYGKPKYQLAEKYKLILASEFIKESGKVIDELYKKVEENIKELREHYEEDATKDYPDKALAWILFLDGCAILQYIYCFITNKFEDLNIKHDCAVLGQQDLFLLENQLPYRLLKWLMKLSVKKKELNESIDIFIKNVSDQKSEGHQAESKKGESLHSKETPHEQRLSMDGERKPTHLLHLLRMSLLDNPEKVSNSSQENSKKDSQSYRNVQDLKNAGIWLKPSKTTFLNDISYISSSCFIGYLTIPKMKVDNSTGQKFFNLMAFEMCPDFINNYEITSYISFLNSLMNHADHVMELRKTGILQNFLGSDQAVAKIFNELGTNLVPNPNIYSDVRADIDKHHQTLKSRMFRFYHDYFDSPWSIPAFFGILLELVLTGIQTWFSVKPTSCS
ncbi:UPF0481 protein At3g47200-like [Quercus robur]|uniref:UPF0481 protein At3g47200-like n=1 Tax=Quercus robur TaxID=38942 RepID=UPI002161FA20|nr:UPF0481 protein At3g47200-like [Quercus robur]